jgi:hypothetical protein
MGSQKIADYCKKHLDLKNAKLSEEYYYNSLPLCVIDAIFSIGMRYSKTRKVVIDFCNKIKIERLRQYGESYPLIDNQFSIEALLSLYNKFDIQEITNNFFSCRNRTSSKHGILKSEAVFNFASVIKKHGVNYFQDMHLIIENEKFEYDIKQIPGQGSGLSLSYFYMLSGEENFIKADRMIIRFIESAIQRKVTKEESLSLIAGAHDILKADFSNLTIRMLDHEIWKFQRQSSNPVSTSSNSIEKAEAIEKSGRFLSGVPKYARILRDRVNRVIVQVPGRSFPGVVLQGDQLFQLAEMAKHSSNQNLYEVLLDLYNDLSSVPDKTTKIQITEIIKDKFKQTGWPASIHNQKGGSFTAALTDNGVNVDNLGSQPFLPWMVFEEAVWMMRLNGGRAQFGKAMSARLGEPHLPYDSIEGHIASQVYGKQHGDSVFRRIVPISNILIWAGICGAAPGELVLRDSAYHCGSCE